MRVETGIAMQIIVDKTTKRGERKWDIYLRAEGNFVSKKRWCLAEKRFLPVSVALGADGVGHALGTIGKVHPKKRNPHF